MNKKEILALFDQWNNALLTKNPNTITALYAQNAVLLPTVSNKVCNNHQDIAAYFTDFMARQPIGKIDNVDVRIYDHIATSTGVYTFSFKNEQPVQARFTFIYQRIDQQWLICHHHSSAMPEKC